jgi:hypothetical protein
MPYAPEGTTGVKKKNMYIYIYIYLPATLVVMLQYIVTYRPMARQQLGKHILAGANALNDRTSITR